MCLAVFWRSSVSRVAPLVGHRSVNLTKLYPSKFRAVRNQKRAPATKYPNEYPQYPFERRKAASKRPSCVSTRISLGVVTNRTGPTCAAASVRAPRGKPKDNSARISKLEREVASLVDAIASGALRASPALVTRLQATEAELEVTRNDEPFTCRVP
jgi:hypothetical protein